MRLRKRVIDRGFTLVAAVFLIAILALLAAYLVNLRVHQDATVTLDALATRAHAAARAGAEWGAYESLRNNACSAATSIALGGTLGTFTATVACVRSTYSEGEGTVVVDTIVSTACNQPVAGNCPNTAPAGYYAERQVTLTVAQ